MELSVNTVKEYLKRWGMEGRVLEFDVSSATVELAAEALGCEPCRIAKTLSFDLAGQTLLIVAAGDAKIDNPRYKARFCGKAKMLSPDQVEERTGHRVGGVCPFAVREGVQVFLDESLRRFPTVYPACGSANSAIELTCSQLEELTEGAEWVDVCKGWRPEEA